MTKEEKIKKIKDYLETKEDIEDFCERVIEEYCKYDNLRKDVHPNFCTFDVGEYNIWIETENTIWNESDYVSITVPLDVFYENNIVEYVKKLSEERTREVEQERKEKDFRAIQ